MSPIKTNTEGKLKEAKFFLLRMEESKTPEFNYYLNAFLSSSRAVTWVMKKEFKRVDGWEVWFNSEKPDEETEEILKKMTQLRNMSTKEYSISSTDEVEINIDEDTITDNLKEFMKSLDKQVIDITIGEASKDTGVKDNEGTFRAKIERSYRSVPQIPDEDILNTCKQYFYALSMMVDKCIKIFGDEIISNNKADEWRIKFLNGEIFHK